MAQSPETKRKIAELERQGLINQPKGRGGPDRTPSGIGTADLASLARSEPIRGRALPITLGTLPSKLERRRLLEELKKQGFASIEGASSISPGKAREILRDGTVHGRPITRKQRGYFGVVASGHRPRIGY